MGGVGTPPLDRLSVVEPQRYHAGHLLRSSVTLPHGHSLAGWLIFAAFFVALSVAELGMLKRRPQAPSLGESMWWCAVVVAAAAAFAAVVWVRRGRGPALQFATGYVVEVALSVDNLLVFMLIFDYFGVGPALRLTALRWGIFGAIAMRGLVIGAGVLILARLSWVLYLLGALLVVTGVRMLVRRDSGQVDPARNPIVRAARHILPVTERFHDARFLVREAGRWMVTPLLLVVLAIEWTDLAFAADSIPAIFAITRDPFLVYTSNIFAIVGLRALYFLVEGAMHRFTRLAPGVGVILLLVGAKMLLSRWIAVPAGAMLIAIVLILGGSLLLSDARDRGVA